MIEPTLEVNTAAAVSDEALIAAITDHQPEALGELYSRHGSRLKSVIGNVVHDRAADAERERQGRRDAGDDQDR